MSIPVQFLDELRQRLTLSDIVARKVKLKRTGREHMGLCPFHNEKSASFSVSDEKGFYHCFGCGAHGDVIGFLIDAEGLGFIEAVERLAAEAGLEMPEAGPRDREAAAKKASLFDLMEEATAWFEARLKGQSGAEARDYLAARGVSEEMRARFRVGLAADHRTALSDAMAAHGWSPGAMAAAGLIIEPDEGPPYDRFRERVMFPISDARGRIVAFGGRALGQQRAKYLNSPETVLFHKGAILYNLPTARGAGRKEGTIVVVEGYMDVIALADNGIDAAVAPLGTALGEDQLHLLWRSVPEPVLCFDGDHAGFKASMRAIERALPLLRPAHSLRFAYLPDGEDPDSFVRKRGGAAFRGLIDKALPLSTALWETALSVATVDTPERRAGFRKHLFGLVGTIRDSTVREFYRSDIETRLDNAFGKRRTSQSAQFGARRWGKAGQPPPGALRRETRHHGLGGRREGTPERREKTLVVGVIVHPHILERQAELFAALDIESPELDKLRREILRMSASAVDLDRKKLRDFLEAQGYGALIASLTDRVARQDPRLVKDSLSAVEAERMWLERASWHGRSLLVSEMERAEVAYAGESSQANWDRLVELKRQLENLESSGTVNFESGV